MSWSFPAVEIFRFPKGRTFHQVVIRMNVGVVFVLVI